MTYQYCIAAGTYTKTAFNALSGTNIEGWPLAADMRARSALAWQIPARAITKRPRPQRYFNNADQSQGHDGWWGGVWGFDHLTFGGYAYIDTNVFAGADWADITYKTHVDVAPYAHTYQVFNARILAPRPGEDYEPTEKGYRNILYRFVHGILLP